MKGQFFIIATIVIISSLSLIIRYLYDFNKIDLTKVEEMYELNYIQYVKESYKETIDAVLSNNGCDRLEADLNYTTKFLKDNLNKKGIMIFTEGPIIETQCSSVKLNFSLVSSEFYSYTEFYFP